MNIIGLDVCKDRVVAWSLSDLPIHIKAYWDIYGKDRTKIYKTSPNNDHLTFFANAEGVSGLLALNPDAIVLEPTGMHYSTFWANVAEVHGIQILWVTHASVASFRKANKLPNKNDVADAYAMACYGLLHYGQVQYFIFAFPAHECSQIRNLYLQIRSISRFRSGLLARLKLQLAHEFPEAACTAISQMTSIDGRRSLVCWLADRHRNLKRPSNYWINRYDDSIVHKYNGGISDFTRSLASQIDDYDCLELKLLSDLGGLVHSSIFADYNQVFDDFDFHLMLRAILLAFIYPLSKFPSISQFKSFIGFGRSEVSSGDKDSTKQAGTSLIKSELYLWVKSKIVYGRSTGGKVIDRRPTSEVAIKVGQKYDEWQRQLSDGDWQQEIVKRSKKEAISKARKELLDIFASYGVRDSDFFNYVIAKLGSLDADIGNTEVKLNPVVAKSSFNNLLVSKTSAYAVRLLYKELVKVLR